MDTKEPFFSCLSINMAKGMELNSVWNRTNLMQQQKVECYTMKCLLTDVQTFARSWLMTFGRSQANSDGAATILASGTGAASVVGIDYCFDCVREG